MTTLRVGWAFSHDYHDGLPWWAAPSQSLHQQHGIQHMWGNGGQYFAAVNTNATNAIQAAKRRKTWWFEGPTRWWWLVEDYDIRTGKKCIYIYICVFFFSVVLCCICIHIHSICIIYYDCIMYTVRTVNQRNQRVLLLHVMNMLEMLVRWHARWSGRSTKHIPASPSKHWEVTRTRCPGSYAEIWFWSIHVNTIGFLKRV